MRDREITRLQDTEKTEVSPCCDKYPLMFYQEEDPEALKRYQRAWRAAHRAARLLKSEFGVSKVAVFGSVTDRDLFTRWSDLDLAVWGLEPRLYYRAVAAVIDLAPELDIDLIDAECCRTSLRKAIDREGIFI